MAILFAVIAVVAFAVPDISIIDIIPDAIGCLLLYLALAVPSEFSNKLNEARTLLFKLTLVTASDAVVSFFVSSDDATMILLVSFCFGIAEAVMLFLVTEKLFDGIVYLGTTFPAKGIYYPANENKLRRYRKRMTAKYEKYAARMTKNGKIISAESVKYTVDTLVSRRSDRSLTKLIKHTRRFFILRAVFNILPEFTALSNFGYEGTVNSYNVDLADFRGLFVVLSVFISGIIGITWLVQILKYINGIRCDTEFRRAIRESYNNNIISNTGLVIYKRLKLALAILSVGVALSIDLVIDHINLVPDTLSALAILIFWLTFLGEKEKHTKEIVMTSVYGVVSLLYWLFVRGYIERFYDFVRTMKSEEAMNAYIICCILSAVTEALFILVMYKVTKKLNAIIYENTGFVSTGGEFDTYSEKLHEKLTRATNKVFVFSVITSVMSVAYQILLGINKGVEAMENGVKYVFYVPVFEGIASLSLIVSILYVTFTIKHITDVSDGLDERYKLD